MAEWSARWTCSPTVPVRVPLCSLSGFVPSRPEIKFPATLVNSQLVALLPVGVFNPVMFCLDYLFLNI